jgi:DNA excision repair protein ERCC-4
MYFLMYQACCEEHKFLLGLRREKDAFTKLIQEHAVMYYKILYSFLVESLCQKMPIYLGDARTDSGHGDTMLKTISTRLAGGRKELSQEPPKV